ncbi:MAG: glycosyltransferase, partial [Paraglaciecola sp.]|nr:glycosyltransferase [Paraglaciecola sp.]
GEECIKRSKDEPAPILKQLDYYKSNNYPPKNGLWETGVLVRRHNNAHCIKMMSEWWLEVFRHSRRDQISLPYVLHGNNENPFIYGADLRRDLNIIHKKHLSYAGSNVSKVFTSPLRIPVDDSCVSATIVVCVYNALEDVIKCLDSVVKYKRAADKVIIVDDFSLPDTEKYLSEFSSNYSEIK